jgi:carboxyl-terminal processing protease
MLTIKKYIGLLWVAVVLVATAAPALAQPTTALTKEQLLMELVNHSLAYHHYAPKELSNAYSELVFTQYLKRIDANKRFFLQEDIDALSKHKQKLDDQLKAGEFTFFDEAMVLFDKRFVQVQAYYKMYLSEPFDFKNKETFETDADKLPYVKTEAELKERWRKSLKYQILTRIQTRLEIQDEAVAKKDTSVKIKTFAQIEQEEREKALKNYDSWATTLQKDKRESRLATFINAFVSVLEPHTEYYPPLEKENFDIRMSGKLEGIGAQLIEQEGFITVSRIVPGSAAWRQGELKEKDKIIKVAQGAEPPVNVVDMKMDDVLPMIRGKKGTEVRLTVRRPDGSILTIPIIREVVVLEDSYAKSAILQHEKAKTKVGLIDLRSFYADFDDSRGRRCAKDVRAEVQKLIAEEVDGIVIDLRFNGGGSLSDVVDMTGLFIDKGPVVQVKSRETAPSVLEDRQSGALYTGPLVILVNSFSASASEILAAALQDYGRAVIIGTSPTTFGKGTVQRFFNLDDGVPKEYKSLGELGAIKITIQKFYRINGSSTQLKGVVPDIILPSQYSYIEVGEREEDFPMEWTEIAPATYKEKPTIRNLDKIKQLSHKRTHNNKHYKSLEEQAQWIKSQNDATLYSLNFDDYKAAKKQESEKNKSYKDLYEKDVEDMTVSALLADQPALLKDTARQESANVWHKALKKDVYLEEAIFVIRDLKK